MKIVAHAKNEISSFQRVGLNLVSSLCCHGRLPLGPRMKEVAQLVGQKFVLQFPPPKSFYLDGISGRFLANDFGENFFSALNKE